MAPPGGFAEPTGAAAEDTRGSRAGRARLAPRRKARALRAGRHPRLDKKSGAGPAGRPTRRVAGTTRIDRYVASDVGRAGKAIRGWPRPTDRLDPRGVRGFDDVGLGVNADGSPQIRGKRNCVSESNGTQMESSLECLHPVEGARARGSAARRVRTRARASSARAARVRGGLRAPRQGFRWIRRVASATAREGLHRAASRAGKQARREPAAAARRGEARARAARRASERRRAGVPQGARAAAPASAAAEAP